MSASNSNAPRIGLYPGSFDPVTNGHIDVIRRASGLFDRLIVAVGWNTAKKPVFSVEERISHLQEACADLPGVEVSSFGGLLAHAAREYGAVAVVRGLRAVSDFEWEFQMALMNREMAEACETIFLMPSPEYSFISSTMIREIARLGGDVSPFVPAPVAAALVSRLGKQAMNANPLEVRMRQIAADGEDLVGETPVAILELPEDERLHFTANLAFRLHLQPVRGGLLVQGSLELPATCVCDRCLEVYAATFRSDKFCHLFEDVNLDSCLDLTPPIREDILLLLPQRLLCRQDCLGLCPKCGCVLSSGNCGCAKTGVADGGIWNCLDALEGLRNK